MTRRSGLGRFGRDVCLWHIADVPLALTNVCFWGNRRHRADFPPFGARNESVDAHRYAMRLLHGLTASGFRLEEAAGRAHPQGVFRRAQEDICWAAEAALQRGEVQDAERWRAAS
jgi:hypothetical protein